MWLMTVLLTLIIISDVIYWTCALLTPTRLTSVRPTSVRPAGRHQTATGHVMSRNLTARKKPLSRVQSRNPQTPQNPNATRPSLHPDHRATKASKTDLHDWPNGGAGRGS